MEYILSVYVGEHRKTKRLPNGLFLQVQRGLEILKEQHAIEARFHNLLNNYITFESSLAQLLIAHTLHPGTIFDPTDETHAESARHLSNFLSSAGGYKSECVRQKSIGPEVKLIFTETKKSSSNFRIAEGLRNYDQHFSLLVHQWSLPSNWTEDRKKRRHGFALALNISNFALGVRATDDILRDLQVLSDGDGNVQLLPITRKYMEELSSVHHQVREKLTTDFEFAKESISNLRQVAIEMGARSDAILQIFRDNDDRSDNEVWWVTERLLVSIEALRKQNSVPHMKFGSIEFFL